MGEFPLNIAPGAHSAGYLPVIQLDLVKRLGVQHWAVGLAPKRSPTLSADMSISGRAHHIAPVCARFLPHRSFMRACASGEPS